MTTGKRISTTLRIEFKSIIQKGGDRYLIVSENITTDKMVITTRVFRNAEPIMNRRKDALRPANPLDSIAIEEMVRNQHLAVIQEVEEKPERKPEKGSHDFLEEARVFLRKRNNAKAYEVLRHGVEVYPEDPYLLTYYGSMASIVGDNVREGARACRKAIDIVKEKMPSGKEDILPKFYVNLARAYMGGHDRKGAIQALYEGTAYEPKDGVIHKELVKFGVRKPPPIPFLRRNNPINKYIGILVHRKLNSENT